MSRVQKLFRVIRRANALILFFAGILGILVLLYGLDRIRRDVTRPRFGQVTATQPTPGLTQSEPRIGSMTAMRGSSLHYARLTIEQNIPRRLYKKSASTTRNLLFFDARTGANHWAFPHNQFNIVSTEELKVEGQVTALLLSVVEADGNADGLLTREDPQILYVATPQALQPVRIETGVDAVESCFLHSPREGFILYTKEEKLWKAPLKLTPPTLGPPVAIVYPPLSKGS